MTATKASPDARRWQPGAAAAVIVALALALGGCGEDGGASQGTPVEAQDAGEDASQDVGDVAMDMALDSERRDTGSDQDGSADDDDGGGDDVADVEQDVVIPQPEVLEPGPWPVGNTTVVLEDEARGRSLRVEIWYPAAEEAREAAEAGEPVSAFVAEEDRERFQALLDAAPDGCPTLRTRGARDAEPASAASRWPLVVFSHCHNCLRFSGLGLAQRLASHGIAVAAPDHTGNTLFNALDGDSAELNGEFLQIRGGDVAYVLDVLLSEDVATAGLLPEVLRGRFDPARLGVMGHSFGAVTAGLVLQDDPRLRVGAALAAPVENPLLPGVEVEAIEEPLLFVVAKEDNSITEFGNGLIRDNFLSSNSPAWKVEIEDAGHWSVSDIAGLTEDLMPGCGEGRRHSAGRGGESFTFLSPARGIEVVQAYTVALFRGVLLEDEQALESVGVPLFGEQVEVQRR